MPRAGYVHVHVKMDLVYGLVWLLTVLLEGILAKECTVSGIATLS